MTRSTPNARVSVRIREGTSTTTTSAPSPSTPRPTESIVPTWVEFPRQADIAKGTTAIATRAPAHAVVVIRLRTAGNARAVTCS